MVDGILGGVGAGLPLIARLMASDFFYWAKLVVVRRYPA
jgi:hypothetical protein